MLINIVNNIILAILFNIYKTTFPILINNIFWTKLKNIVKKVTILLSHWSILGQKWNTLNIENNIETILLCYLARGLNILDFFSWSVVYKMHSIITKLWLAYDHFVPQHKNTTCKGKDSLRLRKSLKLWEQFTYCATSPILASLLF